MDRSFAEESVESSINNHNGIPGTVSCDRNAYVSRAAGADKTEKTRLVKSPVTI